MVARTQNGTARTTSVDDGSGGGPEGWTGATTAPNGASAHSPHAAAMADHGTGLVLLAALLAAAGIASTATCVTLLLRAARPGRFAPHVLGFAGMTLLASSALCLILLAAR